MGCEAQRSSEKLEQWTWWKLCELHVLSAPVCRVVNRRENGVPATLLSYLCQEHPPPRWGKVCDSLGDYPDCGVLALRLGDEDERLEVGGRSADGLPRNVASGLRSRLDFVKVSVHRPEAVWDSESLPDCSCCHIHA